MSEKDEQHPDSAEVATLRLDVAWWRARVEAAERERDEVADEFRRYKEAARGGFAGIDASARAAQRRAEAAEAAQAKLTEALKRIAGYANHLPPCEGGQCVCGLWGAEHAVREALASAASAPQAPPSDAAEEVK